MVNNSHPECSSNVGNASTDTTKSDNPQSLSGQLNNRRLPVTEIRAFAPSTILDGTIVLTDMVAKLMKQRDCVLRHRFGAIRWHVGDGDAALQMRTCLENLQATLRAVDASLDDVISMDVLLADVDEEKPQQLADGLTCTKRIEWSEIVRTLQSLQSARLVLDEILDAEIDPLA